MAELSTAMNTAANSNDMQTAWERSEGYGLSSESRLLWKHDNDSDTMTRALLEDPLAMIEVKDRPAFAKYMQLSGQSDDEIRDAAMKHVTARWFSNQYNIPMGQVEAGYEAMVQNVFGKPMAAGDVYMALREMRQRELNAGIGPRAERLGRNVVAGVYDVNKTLADMAIVATDVSKLYKDLVNTAVFAPMQWLAKQGGWDAGAEFARSMNPLAQTKREEAQDLHVPLRNFLKKISDSAAYEAEYHAAAAGESAGFGEDVALGVARNLPNLLLTVAIAKFQAARMGAAGIGKGVTAASAYFGAGSTASELVDTEADPNMDMYQRCINAVVVGAAEATFEEALGFGKILRRYWLKVMPPQEIKRVSDSVAANVMRTIRGIGLDMSGEGAEEVLTGVTQRVSRLLTNRDGKSIAGMSTLDLAHELLDDVPLEFSVGAASGGILGGMGAHARYKQQKYNIDQLNARADILGAARADLQQLEAVESPTTEQTDRMDFLRGAIAENNADAILADAMDSMIKEVGEDVDDDLTTDEWAAKEGHAALDSLRRQKNSTPGTENRLATVRDLAAKTIQEMNLGGVVEVVQTEEDLPDDIYGKYEESSGIRVEGAWSSRDNKVYLVADSLTPGRVRKVIFHEVVGHRGMREIFGESYDQFLGEVSRTFADDVAALAARRGFDTTDPLQLLEAADEFLAERAETAEEDTVWKRIIGMFRAWLRKHNWDLGWTDADLAYLLRRSAEAASRTRQAAENPPIALARELVGTAAEEVQTEAVETETADPEMDRLRILETLPEKLVAEWDPKIQAKVAAFRRKWSGISLDDGELYTEGMIGLAKAHRNFQEGKGATFATYANRVIDTQLQKVANQEQKTMETASIDATFGADADMSLQDMLPVPQNADMEMRESEAYQIMQEWWNTLPPQKKKIVSLLYRGRSQTEIANATGVSRQRISTVVNEVKAQAREFLFSRSPDVRFSVSPFGEKLGRSGNITAGKRQDLLRVLAEEIGLTEEGLQSRLASAVPAAEAHTGELLASEESGTIRFSVNPATAELARRMHAWGDYQPQAETVLAAIKAAEDISTSIREILSSRQRGIGLNYLIAHQEAFEAVLPEVQIKYNKVRAKSDKDLAPDGPQMLVRWLRENAGNEDESLGRAYNSLRDNTSVNEARKVMNAVMRTYMRNQAVASVTAEDVAAWPDHAAELGERLKTMAEPGIKAAVYNRARTIYTDSTGNDDGKTVLANVKSMLTSVVDFGDTTENGRNLKKIFDGENGQNIRKMLECIDAVQMRAQEHTEPPSEGFMAIHNINALLRRDYDAATDKSTTMWQQLWDLRMTLRDAGVESDFVSEPGRDQEEMDGTRPVTVPGGIKGFLIEYATVDGREGSRVKFRAFLRSIPQTIIDKMNPADRDAFRTGIVRAVEAAYIWKSGDHGTLAPYSREAWEKAFAGDHDLDPADTPKSIIADKGRENIASTTKYGLQPSLRKADKTWLALNVNSACPMFILGNHACYLDACYVTQMARGATGVNLFQSALYTGEILQLSDDEIREVNQHGGLRLNGVGDTTAENITQYRDVIRHASLRGLQVKLISKQTESAKMIQRFHDRDGIDVSNVFLQLSGDSLLIPIEEDFAFGSGIKADGLDLVAEKYERGEIEPDDYFNMVETVYGQGRFDRTVVWRTDAEGRQRLYRKYGFSREQINDLMKQCPDVRITPRWVVCNAAEIADIALHFDALFPEQQFKRDGVTDVIVTLMHGRPGEQCINTYPGEVLNFGALRHVVDVAKQRIYGVAVKEQKQQLELNPDKQHPYNVLNDYIHEPGRFTDAEKDKIYRSLQKWICCQANGSGDACRACQMWCCGLKTKSEREESGVAPGLTVKTVRRLSVVPQDNKRIDALARALLPIAKGNFIDPATAAAYLADHGYEVDLERDAADLRAAGLEAVKRIRERNRGIRRRAENQELGRQDKWLNALIREYGDDFKINAGPKFDGAAFTGTWMDPHKTEKGRAKSIPAAEIAKTLSKALGEEVSVDQVVEHFGHLKRDTMLVEYREKRRNMAELRDIEQQLEETYRMEVTGDAFGGDIPLPETSPEAEKARKRYLKDAAKAERQRKEAWLLENMPPLYGQVMQMLGSKPLIKPSDRFIGEAFTGTFISREFRQYSEARPGNRRGKTLAEYNTRRENALRHADGRNSEALAEAIARETGGDALDIEQDIIDLFRDLTRSELDQKYLNSRREERQYEKAQNAEADAFSAAESFRELLKIAEADKIDIIRVQQVAAKFARKHLPVEQRGVFLERITDLAKVENAPTPRYPEGRRRYELERLLTEIQGYRVASRIRELIQKNAVRANRSGRLIGNEGDNRKIIGKIREIIDLTSFDVENKIIDLREQIAAAEAADSTTDDAAGLREELSLYDLFGKLDRKSGAENMTALKILQELIAGDRTNLLNRMHEKKERNAILRHEATSQITGSDMPQLGRVDTEPPQPLPMTLKNMSLRPLLTLISNRSGMEFDATVVGQLYQKLEKATQAGATAERELGEKTMAAIERIFGLDSMHAKSEFWQSVEEIPEHTGIWVDRYNHERADYVTADGDVGFSKTGRRGIVRQKISVAAARKLLKNIAEGKAKVDPMAEEFLRQQLSDFDLKIERKYYLFGNQDENETWKVLHETDAANREEAEKKTQLLFLKPDPEDKVTRTELLVSRAEAANILMAWEQPDIRMRMEWNGWSETSIAQLKQYIGPEMVEFAYWARSEIAAISPLVDAISRRIYGAGLPDNPNYFPSSYKESLGQQIGKSSADAVTGDSYGTLSVNPTFLIARKSHLTEPDIHRSIFANFFRHMTETNHFLAFGETIRECRDILNAKDVREAISRTYGTNVHREIIDRITTIANAGRQSAAAGEIMGRLFRYWVPAKIALNFSSFAKQIAGAANYLNDVPLQDFVAGVSEAVTGSEEFRRFADFAMDSDYFKNRMAGGLNRDLLYLSLSKNTGKINDVFGNWLLDKSTYITRAGDAVSTIRAGYSVFRYHFRQGLAHGMSESEAWDNAVQKWQRSTDETQQSGYLKDQNFYQSQTGLFRYFTSFLSNPIQIMNRELETIHQLAYGLDREKAKKQLARQIMVNHILVPTLMVAITDFFRHGFDWDEYEFSDYLTAWLLGPFEGWAAFGKFGSAALGDTLGWAEDKIRGGHRRGFVGRSVIAAVPVFDDAMLGLFRLQKLAAEAMKDGTPSADAIYGGLQAGADLAMLAGTLSPIPAAGAVGGTAGAALRELRRFWRMLFEEEKKPKKRRPAWMR